MSNVVMHNEIMMLFEVENNEEIKRLISVENIDLPIGDDGSTLIHYAASFDNKELLQYCIDNGANCEAMTPYGSPLSYAVMSGSEDCIELLLKNGAKVDPRGDDNMTPLMIASGGGSGSDTSRKEIGAPFHYLPNRDNRLRKRMLEIRTDLGLFNITPADPLYDTIADNAQKMMDEESRRTRNFECPDCCGHEKVAALLIAAGASLDPGEETRAGTGRMSSPLNCALLSGHMQIAETLIKNNAPINHVRKGEDPPICIAVREGDVDAVNLLINAGASVDCVDANKQTPLSLAIYREFQEITELIKKHSHSDKGDGISLIRAAQKGQTKQIKELLDAGTNIEFEDSAGNTALTWACANYHEDAVRMLLEAGADPNHVSNNGLTPIFETLDTDTVMFGFADEDLHTNDWKKAIIIEMLCSAGADVNFDSPWGTPLNRSIARRNLPAIKAISKYDGTLNGHFSLMGNVPHHYYESTALWLLIQGCEDAFCEIVEFCSEGIDSQFGYWAGAKSFAGTNFLTCAVEMARPKAIENLIFKQNMPVDFRNKYGTTPLMVAILKNHLDIADQLVSYGASLTATDYDGRRVLDYALNFGDFQTLNWCYGKGLM